MTATLPATAPGMFTTCDGTRLRVLEEGDRDAPVTVVLVHGWTLSKHTWDRVVAGLPAAVGAPVRIVRYDLRGHGESDPAPPGSATIEQCADDLADVVRERVPEGPIVFVGHSMGGMTLMAFAERHRAVFEERAAGVALVGTSCGDLVAPALGLPGPVAAVANRLERRVRVRLAAARGRVLSKRSAALRPGLRWLLFGQRPTAADVASAADWVAGCNPSNMASFRDSLAEHDRLAALDDFRSVPAVVLVGLADRLTPYAHAVRLAEALPHARFTVYAGAGHMLPLERDVEVTARIAGVVRAATGSASEGRGGSKAEPRPKTAKAASAAEAGSA
ncbi:pimeloyl-ACP methyl ester carboxylesterase [Saccharopolyspora erythraea NRRL 2338]|uniref:Alpha/beta hydrolase fold n=2 Tax=Saccharopolyspora erythraea TaxID=1836 RepID=A4F8M4_SACEN|nr:alpha/beta hydrolase [Saccharopolyspora erythraea]EQD86009.1 alpha/beta hydrolase [Saccharopolyspora erythraea D]PFG94193.1 pimeloyl-ACP methyl ester carboxylesterase [Saccharopolyspora erythraea NRRL 2338]QRK90972.1 alpha/beta hydrolase [Saccharopolyspora erythraea]CAM00399.1 alpha/beta hydrolase fold [Saccharopolyspora erythraea NRRL 2338]